MAVDFDEVERTGDLARRAILAQAERSGLTVEAAGKLLAQLAQSADERVAGRALDRFFDLGCVIPNRKKSVRVETDQRAVSATHGRGTLNAALDDAELQRLPPAQRREAIAALETLARLKEDATHGTRSHADRNAQRRIDVHERHDEHDADGTTVVHEKQRADDWDEREPG